TLDQVESVPAASQHNVTLRHTVLCTLDADDLGTPLRYWEDRSATPTRAWETVPSFGPTPLAFQGASDSLVIRGTFTEVDDPFGTYTAHDVRRMVEAMGAPVVDEAGIPHSRLVCYRDPLGRVALVALQDVSPADQHERNRVVMGLEMIEIEAAQGVLESEVPVG